VKVLKYDLENGRGRIVAEASSGGADPCHLAISGHDLFVANYSGGSVAIFPLSSTFPYLPRGASRLISFSGTGPITSRQEASHPHQVLVHPHRDEVIIPDLGADKLWRLGKEGSEWAIKDKVDMPTGGGPRHAVVVGDKLFTLLELSNHITSHEFPPLPEAAVLLQKVATLSDPPSDPTRIDPPPLSAEILGPPVTDDYATPYLYVTNRNDPSPEGDILSVFAMEPAGSVKLVREIRTGLNHLRGIAFDETGRYLVAGGAFGNGVKIYERKNGGKELREMAYLTNVENPTGFQWLTLAGYK